MVLEDGIHVFSSIHIAIWAWQRSSDVSARPPSVLDAFPSFHRNSKRYLAPHIHFLCYQGQQY